MSAENAKRIVDFVEFMIKEIESGDVSRIQIGIIDSNHFVTRSVSFPMVRPNYEGQVVIYTEELLLMLNKKFKKE